MKRYKSREQKKISGSCSGSNKKSNQINTIFSVAAVDPKDNVTQPLSDPNNDNLNLICAAESASKSESTLPESVEQNQLSTSTGATSPKDAIDTSPSLLHNFCDPLPSHQDEWPNIVSDALRIDS